MRNFFKEYYSVFKRMDSPDIDKQTKRKITNSAILFAMPVMIIYLLLLFSSVTVFSGTIPTLNIIIGFLPIFSCIFSGLVSLFTIQLLKIYLSEDEFFKNIKNAKMFLTGMLNPYILIFSIVITILICIVL